jgi:hypothetical protein
MIFMSANNRFDRLSKREPESSSSYVVLAPETGVVVKRGKRSKGRERTQRRRSFLAVMLVWVLLTVAFVVFLSLRPRRTTLRSITNPPTSFPVSVGSVATHQVKDVKAVWLRERQQGGQPCDVYEVRGNVTNRKESGDSVSLEVAMMSEGIRLNSGTFIEQVPPGKEKPFALQIQDFSFARERRRIHFVLSVVQ